MNTKFIIFTSVLLLGVTMMSCNGNRENDRTERARIDAVLKDHGPAPLVVNIEDYTLENENFRLVLWTGEYLQVALMSIPVGGEIGLEVHDGDQFLRIESGRGRAMMGSTRDALTIIKDVEDDYAIFVPAGKWHNLINTGNTPLKIYSIYAPVEHPHSTVHRTPECDEHHH